MLSLRGWQQTEQDPLVLVFFGVVRECSWLWLRSQVVAARIDRSATTRKRLQERTATIENVQPRPRFSLRCCFCCLLRLKHDHRLFKLTRCNKQLSHCFENTVPRSALSSPCAVLVVRVTPGRKGSLAAVPRAFPAAREGGACGALPSAERHDSGAR
jgi:hypothetical protein